MKGKIWVDMYISLFTGASKCNASWSLIIILFWHIFHNTPSLNMTKTLNDNLHNTWQDHSRFYFPVCEGSTNVVRTKVEIVLMRIVVTFGTHFFLLFHWPTTTLLKNLSKNSSTLETFYPTKNVKTLIFIFSKSLRSWKWTFTILQPTLRARKYRKS